LQYLKKQNNQKVAKFNNKISKKFYYLKDYVRNVLEDAFFSPYPRTT